MGKYIYMTGSDVKSKDSVATLRSESLSLRIQSNLSFWYHMNGFGIGQLVLSKIKEKKSEELWKMEGRQGQDWLRGSVLLNPGKFTLEFSGTAVLPYSSDTALDDIQLHSESPGECTCILKN